MPNRGRDITTVGRVRSEKLPVRQSTTRPPHDALVWSSIPELRIGRLQNLVDLVRGHLLTALDPIYQILQLRLLVHIAHQ